ncbi:hypothetical protein D3C86_2112700 [compost metagenome]
MYDQRVILNIGREGIAVGIFEDDLLAGSLSDPAGNLHPSDVVGLLVVGTGFRDKYLISVLQLLYRLGSFDQLGQVAFVTGK